MYPSRVIYGLLALTLAALGCDGVRPSNPYDPGTPREEQALARVRTKIVAPDVAAELVTVTLTAADTAPRTVTPTAEGIVDVENLRPGRYGLACTAPGYYPLTRELELEAGVTLDLGEMPLVRAVSEESLVDVSGSARLENQRSSAGITVRVVDTAYGTVTDAEGGWALRLTPGRYTFRFSANGYEPVLQSDVDVAKGAGVTLEPVTLRAQPASLTGHVCAEIRDDLRRGGVLGGEGACAQAGVAFRAASDGSTGALVTVRGPDTPNGKSVAVDASGAFSVGDLTPGLYALSVEWAGYRRTGQQAIALQGGDDLALTVPYVLTLARGGVTGVVRLPGANDHGGTVVSVEGWDASAVTDGAGRFTVPGLVDSVLAGPYQLVASHRPQYADLRLPTPIQVEADRLTPLARDYTLDVRTGDLDVKEGTFLRSCALTLLLESSTARQYRVALDGGVEAAAFAPFVPPDPTHPREFPWEIPDCETLPDGRHTVSVQFADDAGVPSSPLGTTVILDRKPPAAVWAGLAGASPRQVAGAPGEVWFTRSETGIVALDLSAIDPPAVEGGDPAANEPGSGVAEVLLDETPAFAAARVLPFGPSATVTLPSPGADGLKELYVRMRDRAGNTADLVDAEGTPAPLRLVLDRVRPRELAVTVSSLASPPPPDAAWTSTPQVALTLSGTDEHPELLSVRVSNDSGFRAASWQPFSTWQPWVLPTGDGEKTIHVQFRDGAGNEAPPLTATITLATTAPGSPTATLTTPVPVRGYVPRAATEPDGIQLATSAIGAFQLEVSGDVSGGGTGWLPYATAWSGALGTGDGGKTIRVRFRDRAGNVATAAPLVVELDTTAPGVAAAALTPSPWARTRLATLAVPAIGADEVRVSGELSSAGGLPANVGAWMPWRPTLAVELTDGDGPKPVTVELRDSAGNEAESQSATTSLDTTAPVATLVVTGARADGTPETTLTASRHVTVAVEVEETGSGPQLLRLAATAAELAAAPWRTFAPIVPWTLAAEDGPRTVVVQLRDVAGNDSPLATPFAATIALDSTAPSTPVLAVTSPASPGAGNALSTREITITLASTDAAGPLDSGRVLVQGDVDVSGAATTGWLAAGSGGLTYSGGLFTWSGQLSAGDGAKAVTVTVRDAAGNASPASTVRFLLQTSAPSSPTATLSPAPYATSTAATLTLGAAGASELRVGGDLASVDGLPASVGAWIPYESSLPVALAAGDGTKTLTVEFRNEAGLATTPLTLTTVVDTAIPSGALAIAGTVADGTTSASLTGQAKVTLGITADDATSGATHMRLGNSTAELGAAAWRAVVSGQTWSLTPADGDKSVHLQLRDAAGLVSSLATPITASIRLDTTAPTRPTLAVTSPASLGTGNALSARAFTITIASTDAAGALDSGRVLVQGDVDVSGAATTGWLAAGSGGLTYSGGLFTWSGQLSAGDGAKAVTVTVRDAAGNASPASTVRFLLQTSAPSSPTATLAPAPYATTTTATLTLGAAGASELRVAGDLASVDGLPAGVGAWIPYESSLPVVLSAGDGTKTITVAFRNEAGLATTPLTVTTVLDTAIPTGAISISGVTAESVSSTTLAGVAQVTLAITAADATSGVTQMRLGNTVAELGSAAWRALVTGQTWTLPPGDGTKTVYLQLKDAAGQASSVATPISGAILLDTIAPSIPALAVTSPASLGTGNALTTQDITLTITSADAAGALATGRVLVQGDVDVSGAATTGWLASGAGGLTYAAGVFTWTGRLSAGDGAKAVTVQVRDAAGHVSPANTLRFLLQTSSPESGTASLSAAPWTTTTAATVTLGAAGASHVRLAGDLASVDGLPGSVGAWIPYETSVPVVLTTGDGTKTITVTFRNEAGVATAPIVIATGLDTAVPTGGLTLTGVAADSAASGTVTALTQISLGITASDATSGATQMRLGNTAAELASAAWRALVSGQTWTLAAGDGSRTVYLQLKDAAGQVSSIASPISATILLDTTAPTAPALAVTSPASLGTNNALSTRAVTVRITSTDAAGTLSTGRVLVQGDIDASGAATTGWLAAGSGGLTFAADVFTWSGNLSAADGAKAVTISVRDAAGNVSTASTVRFVLQTAAPTGGTATLSPAPYATTTAATLTLSATGASELRIAGDLASVDGLPASVGAWIPYRTSVPVVLTAGDGTKTLTVAFRNDALLATTPLTVTTPLDTAIPTGALAVHGRVGENGTSTVLSNSTLVSLAIQAGDATSGPTHMRVGNTGAELAAAPWNALVSGLAWTLPTGDGVKTVLLQLRDAAGLVSSAAAPISGTIRLDTTPPTTPGLIVTAPASLGTGNALSTRAVTLTISATDAAGSLAPGRVLLQGDLDSAGAASTGWLAAGTGGLTFSAGTFTWSGNLSAGDGPKAITVFVRDPAGNASAAATQTFLLQTVAPTNPAASLADAPYATVTATTLSLSATGASEVRVAGDLASVDGLPGNVGAWIPYASSLPVTLTAGDGPKSVTVRFRNQAGLMTAALTRGTLLDTALPTGTLTIFGPIADGAASPVLTGSPQVTLRFTAVDATSGPSHLRLADSVPGLESASWRALQDGVPWTLAGADGAKTLYFQLRDAAGNVSSGTAPLSGSTTLDTGLPSRPALTILSPAALGTGNALSTTAVTIQIASADVAGSLASGRVQLQGDLDVSGASTTGWLAAGTGGLSFSGGSFTWTGALSSGDGAKTVTVQVRDPAGHVSAANSVSFLLQTAPPALVSATLAPAPYAASTAATLALAATGAAEMRLAGDLASVDGLPGSVGNWIAFSASPALVLTTGDGPKSVTIRLRNQAGLLSTVATRATTLDTLGPTGSLQITGLVAGGGASTTLTGSRQVTLAITSADATSRVTEMRVADSSAALSTAAWQPMQTSLAWSLPGTDGTKFVHLQLRDEVGHASGPLSASTTLDLTPPSVPDFGALPAATSLNTLTLFIGTAATDALSSPVQYELRRPGADDWARTAFPVDVSLVANTSNEFRLRAVDGAGNLSAEQLAVAVHDSTAPARPRLLTPRLFVDATTTSVTLSGNEDDPTFARYETCTATVAVDSSCPGTCAFAISSASFALSLTSGQRTCVRARAVDVAGNPSPVVSLSVVSDLSRPTPPAIGPSYAPQNLTIRAPSVQLFVQAPAIDLPLGGESLPWEGISHLELDSGAGFSPLCPGALVGNRWAPCDPAAATGRCTDARLRCQGVDVSGFQLPLVEGILNDLIVRAVDLAGNVGDGAAVLVQTEATAAVTSATGTETMPDLYGSSLGYISTPPSQPPQPMLLELGTNRRADPADPRCNPDVFRTSYYTLHLKLSPAGAVFDAGGSVQLRRRGADGRFCTGDEGALVALHTGQYRHVAAADQMAAIVVVDPASTNYCHPVVVRENAWNEVLGDGDDWTNTLPHQVQARWYVKNPLQVTERAMLLNTGGCPNPDNDGGTTSGEWKLVHRVISSTWKSFFYGSPNVYTFTAREAQLSRDGRQLLTFDSYVLTLRNSGADGLFGTADDVVASRPTTGWVEFLAIDGHRTLALEGASNGQNVVRLWGAGADGVFQSGDPSDDDYRVLGPTTDARRDPTLSLGLAIYGSKGNLYAEDLTLRRWEAVPAAPASWPSDTGAGGIVFIEESNASGPRLVARHPNGTETRTSFNLGLEPQSYPAYVGDGDNLLVTGTDTAGNRVLLGVRRGGNLPWFQGDTTYAVRTAAATNYLFPIAAGDGKALYYDGPWSDYTPYVLEPGTGGSWAVANVTRVDILGANPKPYNVELGGVSRDHAAWTMNVVYVRSAGPDRRFGTADDIATTPLLTAPGGSTQSADEIAIAGNRIALRSRGWSEIRVLDAGADRRFNTADDLPIVVPVATPGVCEYNCSLRLAGDFLSYVSPDATTGADQLFLHDLRTKATVQLSFHDSRKTRAIALPSGRTLWADSIFTQRSIFLFAP